MSSVCYYEAMCLSIDEVTEVDIFVLIPS